MKGYGNSTRKSGGKKLSAERIKQLKSAVEHAHGRMDDYRENRKRAIREYVGAHFSENGCDDRRLFNMIALAADVYLQNLVPKMPRAMVRTEHMELRPIAHSLELAMDHVMKEIDFKETLDSAVFDALFSIGCIKVGLCGGNTVKLDDTEHEYGQVFADFVDLDDLVIDITARRFSECAYVGHRYRMPLESAKKLFKGVKIHADDIENTNESAGDERQEEIFSTSRGEAKFGEWVECWDIWLPFEGVVVTYPTQVSSTYKGKDVYRIVEWAGPERGPFHFLCFHKVPGTPLPVPPVERWIDLNDTINVVGRKSARQAERQKTIGVVGPGVTDKDTEGIVGADDGEVIRVQDPQRAAEMKLGGVEQVNLAFLQFAMQQLSYMAGNLDAIGGLASSADTLGQDELLTGSASVRIQQMAGRVHAFVKGIQESIAWYLWHDPFIDLPITKTVPGTDVRVPTRFNDEAKEGDYFDFNIDVDPYSANQDTPGSRLNAVMQIVNTLMPLLPFAEQQGVALNVEALVKLLAKLLDIKEINELVTTSNAALGGPVGQPAPGSAPVRQSPVTTRRYVRENKSTATRQGQAATLMNTLLGGNPQKAQQAQMFQGAGG